MRYSRAFELARAGLSVADAQSRQHGRARAVRRRRHRQGRAARRDRLAVSAGGGFTRTGIGTIVDMDSLEIEVDVSEAFIDRVHPEQAGGRSTRIRTGRSRRT